jgi:hypothetical protein
MALRCILELEAPIPQGGDPNLLGTLHYAGSQHPNFSGGTLRTFVQLILTLDGKKNTHSFFPEI